MPTYTMIPSGQKSMGNALPNRLWINRFTQGLEDYKMRKPPKNLKGDAKKLWQELDAEYAFEAHHYRLLDTLCHCWQRVIEAQQGIQEHGTIFIDRYGQPRERPECDAERKNKALFMRLLREMALDLDVSESRKPRQY